MAEQKPSVGRILIFTLQPHEAPYNNHRDHPCIITKVWTDDCVNVKVFFDCGPVEDRTSQQFSTGMVKWPARARATTATRLSGTRPSDGHGGHRHEPLTKREGDTLWEHCEAERLKRAADMPDERSALLVMGQAYERLRELGWREAIYCPKDGTSFFVIEPGSTGVHDAHYSGEWPNGSWWIEAEDDLWPSRPSLFKLYPEDQAKEDARLAALRAKWSTEATLE